MSLNKIIFEHIDDKYAYGKYSDFTVIIMKENRYINATKLCKEYNKELSNWKQNKGSLELIEEVEKEISINGYPRIENKSFIIIKGGNNQLICGTYVHELLIPHIASWISPRFGIMVSKIINNHIVNEYIKTLKEKDTSIKERDDKIEELIKLMKESDMKAEKRTKKIIDKLEDTHLKSKKKQIDYRYYGVRGQPNYVNRKSNKKITEDKYIEILRINNVANAVNLWNRLKEQLSESVDYCGNEMNLIDINEIEFINIIKDIYEKRKYIEIENNNSETDT